MDNFATNKALAQYFPPPSMNICWMIAHQTNRHAHCMHACYTHAYTQHACTHAHNMHACMLTYLRWGACTLACIGLIVWLQPS